MPREKRDNRPGKKPWPPVRERPQGPCQNHARHRAHRNREHERDDDGGEGESVTSSLDVHHRRPQQGLPRGGNDDGLPVEPATLAAHLRLCAKK